jgi:hypothetical protein
VLHFKTLKNHSKKQLKNRDRNSVIKHQSKPVASPIYLRCMYIHCSFRLKQTRETQSYPRRTRVSQLVVNNHVGLWCSILTVLISSSMCPISTVLISMMFHIDGALSDWITSKGISFDTVLRCFLKYFVFINILK